MNKVILIVLFTIGSMSVFGQREIDSKFGKGLYNVVSSDSSWSMKFGMRFQTLYSGENNINDTTGIGKGISNFSIRRARLKFGGFAYSPKLKYKVELGLSNQDISGADTTTKNAPRFILDAVLRWNFYQNFELWAGQTKLAGNRERVISSANMQLVDRSKLNSIFNIDRDMGMQLRHHMKFGKEFIVREVFSVSQGEGRNLVQNNLGGLQYTSRLELLPFGKFAGNGDYVGGDIKREQKPKLSVGATYDFNDRAVKDRSNMGEYMSYDTNNDDVTDGHFESNISTVFIDVMFKYRGFSFMGEYAKRDANKVQQTIVNDDLSTTTKTVYVGDGINLQAGYLLKSNWEIAGRYTQINPGDITGESAFRQYTLGISKYVVGHALKVQSDVSYLTTEGSRDSGLMYRLQIDIHF